MTTYQLGRFNEFCFKCGCMNEDVCLGCPDNPQHPWGDWIDLERISKDTISKPVNND